MLLIYFKSFHKRNPPHKIPYKINSNLGNDYIRWVAFFFFFLLKYTDVFFNLVTIARSQKVYCAHFQISENKF